MSQINSCSIIDLKFTLLKCQEWIYRQIVHLPQVISGGCVSFSGSKCVCRKSKEPTSLCVWAERRLQLRLVLKGKIASISSLSEERVKQIILYVCSLFIVKTVTQFYTIIIVFFFHCVCM